MSIRVCAEHERAAILEIVNAAAAAYRGVIPADRWHDPYMPRSELDAEIADGVVFWGSYESGGTLLGVMGIQNVGDFDLIRHAYVLPTRQRGGVGSALLQQLMKLRSRPMLVGTWADASWAIEFYRRHGFSLLGRDQGAQLLRKYWSIPDRQVETSVVLANPLAGPGRAPGGGSRS